MVRRDHREPVFISMLKDIKNSKTALLEVMKDELSNVRLRDGEVVDAELLRKTPRGVFFDLGKFGTGIVYGAEFINARNILKKLNPGDRVSARIETIDGEGGYVELSLAEASKQKLWQQVQELQESGEVVKVKITGSNPSGLLADLLGLKAFLPLSQLSPEHYPKGAPGDNQKGIDVIVSGIADFGIFVRFVDNPQIEGLVHISELDHKIIDSPKEIVGLDEAVKVRIIDIKEGRVFLSIKALKSDPWENVAALYKAGQEVSGKVYKFNPFGAVIELEGGIQGLIHISEFGNFLSGFVE